MNVFIVKLTAKTKPWEAIEKDCTNRECLTCSPPLAGSSLIHGSKVNRAFSPLNLVSTHKLPPTFRICKQNQTLQKSSASRWSTDKLLDNLSPCVIWWFHRWILFHLIKGNLRHKPFEWLAVQLVPELTLLGEIAYKKCTVPRMPMIFCTRWSGPNGREKRSGISFAALQTADASSEF